MAVNAIKELATGDCRMRSGLYLAVVTVLVEFWVVPTVTAVPAVTVEPWDKSLFLDSEETELVLVDEPLRLFAFVPVESEFVVVEPSGFVTVFVVDESTDCLKDFVSEVSVAAPCKAVAVWFALAF